MLDTGYFEIAKVFLLPIRGNTPEQNARQQHR